MHDLAKALRAPDTWSASAWPLKRKSHNPTGGNEKEPPMPGPENRLFPPGVAKKVADRA